MKQQIALRLMAGNKFGLGHLARLQKLSLSLKSDYFWIIESENKNISKLINKKNGKYIISKKIDDKKVIKKILKLGFKKIIFDLPDNNFKKKKEIISLYKSNSFKTVSYDLPKYQTNADIKIIPYLTNYKSLKNKNIFLGPQYLGLRFKKSKKSKINKILISISGSDKLNIGKKIFDKLKDTKFKITYIQGLNKKKLATRTHKIIQFNQSLIKIIDKNDLIITGEGMTKYDVVYRNKPLIIVQQFRSNDLIKVFNSKKVGYLISKNVAKLKILNLIDKFNYLVDFQKNQKKIFGGKSNLSDYKKMINKIISL